MMNLKSFLGLKGVVLGVVILAVVGGLILFWPQDTTHESRATSGESKGDSDSSFRFRFPGWDDEGTSKEWEPGKEVQGNEAYPVDLVEIKQRMPNNSYWELYEPSTNPEIIEYRKQEQEKWNKEYGKVLAGDASSGDIENYFARQQKISEDQLEFLGYLKKNYSSRLPERDLGLIDLGINLHTARLQQIPRDKKNAYAKKHDQDAKRTAYQK